jgi:CRP-like cAMP-binding protein
MGRERRRRVQQEVAAHRGFLGRLAEADRTALLEAMAPRRFEDGAEIVSQGERSSDVFFMLEGRAMATIYAHDGRLVLIREIAAGDIFGEFAAIDGAPRTADVVASGPVRAGRMTREALFSTIAASPGVGEALMKHLVEIIRALGDRIHEQTTLQVRERLLRELVRLGRAAAGPAQDRASLTPSPTHAALAANIGTHREAVTKQLSAFARQGLIVKIEGGLRLPSIRALEREAERGAG